MKNRIRLLYDTKINEPSHNINLRKKKYIDMEFFSVYTYTRSNYEDEVSTYFIS